MKYFPGDADCNHEYDEEGVCLGCGHERGRDIEPPEWVEDEHEDWED